MQTTFTDAQLKPKVKRWLRAATFVIDLERINRHLEMPYSDTIKSAQVARVLRELKAEGSAVTGKHLGGTVWFWNLAKKAEFFERQASGFYDEWQKCQTQPKRKPSPKRKFLGIF
jgi:hypothetical protein